MWCDTHCHLNFEAFENSVETVITQAEAADVAAMVVIGTTLENSQRAVELAEQHSSVAAVVGLHPHHVARWCQTRSLEELEAALEHLVSHPEVVAVGETGFDNHVYQRSRYGAEPVEAQTQQWQSQVFELHWRLAARWQRTLVLHSRQAAAQLAGAVEQLLASGQPRPPQLVLHCCEPDARLLELARRHHCWIGLDGDITSDPARAQLAQAAPASLLLLETDAPYLSYQGSDHQSSPRDIPQIAQHLAQLRSLDSLEQLEHQLWLNSQQAFFHHNN